MRGLGVTGTFDPMISTENHPGLITALFATAIRTFSGKWKLSILWHLRHRSLRFVELASLLPGVTSKVLAYQLRDLVEAGLVIKTESIAPRRTRYGLTESGVDAMPLLELLYEWGHWQMTRSPRHPTAVDRM
jgi:DNA-binding HxlR family transcriptional regulator